MSGPMPCWYSLAACPARAETIAAEFGSTVATGDNGKFHTLIEENSGGSVPGGGLVEAVGAPLPARSVSTLPVAGDDTELPAAPGVMPAPADFGAVVGALACGALV